MPRFGKYLYPALGISLTKRGIGAQLRAPGASRLPKFVTRCMLNIRALTLQKSRHKTSVSCAAVALSRDPAENLRLHKRP